MANTSVTYAADGVSTGPYTIPFPYIAQSHVKCKVDGNEVLNPSIWYFATDSTVVFRNAVPDGSAIYFYRQTPGDTRLVDFQNGAVLTEQDLDLAIDQVFYLAQEAKENYAELVNNETFRIGTSQGINTTDPDEMIASLVDTLLADAAAATLQAAVGDIELNGEVILDIQTKLDGSIEVIDLIGAFNGDQSAFLLDTTKVKLGTLDTDPTFASKITTLEAADAANSASITTIQTVTIPGIQSDVTTAQSDILSNAGDISTAQSDITTLDGRTTTAESDIDAAESNISTLQARYGVALTVNNYVTGFVQNNDGTSGNFAVLADKFAIVEPAGTWAASTAYSLTDKVRPLTSPPSGKLFRCTTAGTSGGSEPTWNTTLGGTTNDGSVVWTCESDQRLLWDGTNDELSLDGYISFTTDGAIRRNKTSGSDTTAGFWLGTDGSGSFDFNVGDSLDYIKFDGSSGVVSVAGDLFFNNALSSFTPTWTGFSSAPSGNISYFSLGNLKVMYYNGSTDLTGTGNATTMKITNIPSAIRPKLYSRRGECQAYNNGQLVTATFDVNTSGTMEFYCPYVSGTACYQNKFGWTSSSSKGLARGALMMWTYD